MREGPPLTCGGCALLCDDVVLQRDGEAVRLEPQCDLGARWFAERLGAQHPAATIDGAPAELDAAVNHAAALLREARRPMIHGFEQATVEDARAGVALADRLGALVVTDPMAPGWPGAPAVPLRGASSATLGEIRDRAQVIVVWREDPMTTHPRLLERLRADDGDRTLVVVDDRDTATTAAAGVRLSWPATRDLDALRRVPEDLRTHIADAVHMAIIYGPGLTAGPGGERRALALHDLVRALSHDRHVVTLALPPAAGTRSARDVLTWQTGYGPNVDLASGHPELVTATHVPGEDADVALAVRADALEITAPAAAVRMRIAAAGVAATGTAHRLDGVPVPLHAPCPDEMPTAAQLLARLTTEVAR